MNVVKNLEISTIIIWLLAICQEGLYGFLGEFFATLVSMRNKKRPFHFLLLAILIGIGLGYVVNAYPPSATFPIAGIQIPLFPFVALAFLLCSFSFLTYFLHNYLQGLLVAIFIGTYLGMRMAGITHIFFLLVLLALFGSLELFFLKKR